MAEPSDFTDFLNWVPQIHRQVLSRAIAAGAARKATDDGKEVVIFHDAKSNEDLYWFVTSKGIQTVIRKPCDCPAK